MSGHTVQNPRDALLAHQAELERLYSRNELMPRIKAEFTEHESLDFKAWLAECGIPEAFGIDLLAQMALHKRATVATMVGILWHHFEDAQATASMLQQAVEQGLLYWEADPAQRPSSGQLVVRFTVTNDVQFDLDRFQFPLPMVVEPLEIRDNLTSGYIVNTKESVILRDNHTKDDVCLDHLNRVNRVKLTINMDTVRMVQNRWKHLDKPKPGEDIEKFKARRKAFAKFDRTSRDLIDLLMQHTDHWFLTHAYDARGRIYCRGYQFNYMGNSWSRAIVEMADKELTV